MRQVGDSNTIHRFRLLAPLYIGFGIFHMDSPEILVSGAGPVGLCAALALTRRGISVQIIDTGVWACKHSYALAVHPQAFPLLRELGVLDPILAASHPVHAVTLCDQSGPRARIQIDGHLAVVRQDRIEEILGEALKAAGVEVQWRHELGSVSQDNGRVHARIDKLEKESRGYIVAHTEWVVAKSYEVEPRFVVGADGYNSRVRRSLGISFPELAPASYYAVFEFQSDVDLRDEMRLLLGERTTDVLWPLPDTYCRWSFQLPDYSDPEAERLKDRLLEAGFGYFPTERTKERLHTSTPGALPVLDETNLKTLLAERAPWFQSPIGHITWRTMVRFERRLADRFGRGRLWLTGDAAHLTGPAGVQSMNVGFAEACDLAAALEQILRGKGGENLLDAYNQRWSAVWKQLHGTLHATPQTDPWIATRAGVLTPCLPAHGTALAQLAAQIHLQL